jgi:hypothetical protein
MNINKNNHYELEILKQVEKSAHLNNRMVAAKLDCSVKLAHGLLKKMVQKGFFNVKKLNSRRWDYYLTPRGIAEKARLTYEFLEFSMKFYKEARKKSSQVCKDIAETGNRNVVFIGSGELAEICYLGVKEWGLDLIGVYDEIDKKQFMGLKVQPLSELSTFNSQLSTLNYLICLYDKSSPMTKNYLPEKLIDILNKQRTNVNISSTTCKHLSADLSTIASAKVEALAQIELLTKFHWIF